MKWGCVHENEGIQYCKLNQIAFQLLQHFSVDHFINKLSTGQ